MNGEFMNFSQLLYVKTTAELGSFSQAAHDCNVTQPTLSNGISKLEAELKHKIFNRTTRAVSLTRFGQQLLPNIERILALKLEINQQANLFDHPLKTTIKLGFSPLINSHIFTQLIEEYKQTNQDISVIFIEDNLTELESKLKDQQLDMILIPMVDKKLSQNEVKLYQEDLFLVDAKTDQASEIELDNIRDRTFVMVPDSCGLAAITRTLLRTNIKNITEYEGKALSYQALADWASNGLGVALLPKSKIADFTQSQKLVKTNQAVKIGYKAKWLASNHFKINALIQHFTHHLSLDQSSS